MIARLLEPFLKPGACGRWGNQLHSGENSRSRLIFNFTSCWNYLRWGWVASPAFTKAECNAPPWVSPHLNQLRQELFTLWCTTIGQQQRHQHVNFHTVQHQSVTTVTQDRHFSINVKWLQLTWLNRQLSNDKAYQYPMLPFSSHHKYLYHCQACSTNPMGKLWSKFSFALLTNTGKDFHNHGC